MSSTSDMTNEEPGGSSSCWHSYCLKQHAGMACGTADASMPSGIRAHSLTARTPGKVVLKTEARLSMLLPNYGALTKQSRHPTCSDARRCTDASPLKHLPSPQPAGAEHTVQPMCAAASIMV
jgi:hypothetical protein